MAGKVLNDPPAKVLRVTVSCQGRGPATTLGGCREVRVQNWYSCPLHNPRQYKRTGKRGGLVNHSRGSSFLSPRPRAEELIKRIPYSDGTPAGRGCCPSVLSSLSIQPANLLLGYLGAVGGPRGAEGAAGRLPAGQGKDVSALRKGRGGGRYLDEKLDLSCFVDSSPGGPPAG